jgi:hypothetical protein
MNTKIFFTLTLGGLLLASPVYLAAQDQSQGESVADAARKAQAEKKDATKSKMVIDNDSLDKITGTINVVGSEPAKADDPDKKLDDKDKQTTAKDEKYWRQKFADANKKLTDDEKELDILQREYNLKQQQYYADPMASLKQEYSRQDLNDSKAKIDDKTAVVAQDKAAISDLEDQLHQAGGDPGWASAPAQPASESAPSQ